MGWIVRLSESYRKYRLIKTSNQILSDYEKSLAFAIKPSFALHESATFKKLRQLEKAYVEMWQAKLAQQPNLRSWLNKEEGLSYQAHYANTFLRLRLLTESHLSVLRINTQLKRASAGSAYRLTSEQQGYLKDRDHITRIIKQRETCLSTEKSSWYRIARQTKHSLWAAHLRLSNVVAKNLNRIAPDVTSRNNAPSMVSQSNLERGLILRSASPTMPLPKALVLASRTRKQESPSMSLSNIFFRGTSTVMRSLYRNNTFLTDLARSQQRDIAILHKDVQTLEQKQEEQVQELQSISQEIAGLRQFKEELVQGAKEELEMATAEVLAMLTSAQPTTPASALPDSRDEDNIPKSNKEKQIASEPEISLKGFLSLGMNFIPAPKEAASQPSIIHPACLPEDNIFSPSSSVRVH